MRVCLAIALIITVAAEMLSSQPGIGQLMLLAARAFRSADIFAGIFVLGALGFLSNLLLERSRRICFAGGRPWAGRRKRNTTKAPRHQTD